MERVEILDLIYQSLKAFVGPQIVNISADFDSDSGEIFLDMHDGRSWVISSSSIKETDVAS